jgi:hypothetical protein
MPGKALKCIGGIADGLWRTIQPGAPYLVVHVRQPARSRFNVTGDPGPPLVETRAEHYVVERVLSDGDMIEFLRPADWTSLQALRHVLT